jgi:hypothetical protein
MRLRGGVSFLPMEHISYRNKSMPLDTILNKEAQSTFNSGGDIPWYQEEFNS